MIRLSGAAWASRLVAVFGIGPCLLAVFPQEPMDQPLTWHGAIHRYVALAAFVALPLAGLVLGQARRLSCAAFAARRNGRPVVHFVMQPLATLSFVALASFPCQT